jgi:NADH-quinone oxidoreductase subunit M
VLSFIVFLPLMGALAIALLPREQEGRARELAAAVTLVVFLASLILFSLFDRSEGGFQFTEQIRWIRASEAGFDIKYFLGVDGLSVVMLVLATFLFPLAVFVSWSIDMRPKEYFVWMLILETGVLGVFTSLDLVLFFLFWEVELIPMYMLISIWGTGRKVYSAMKFVLYTIAGSGLMLAGILILGFAAGTFDMVELTHMQITEALIPMPAVFFLIFAAFAVKLPVFPLHTWLPDAHTDAPTAVSVILAGILLKMGGYGMIRLCVSILPDVAHQYAVWLTAFAAVNVVYGAIVTLRQTDLKRLIAYSSISHMGYVLLGIFALGQVSMTGATLQMFTHGTITGLLFVMVGLVYDRAHTRDISVLSGLAPRMPLIATVFVVAGLASLGLPTMSGFVSELLVFLGSVKAYTIPTLFAVVGILLTAGYILWMLERVFFGPPNPRWAELVDATRWWERLPMVGLVASILAIGIYPATLVPVIEAGITPIVARLG